MATLNKAERHYVKMNKLWGVSNRKKITYYLLADREEMIEVLGKNTSGFAKLDDCAVYSLYPFHPHEITHLVTNGGIKRRPVLALSEGVAVFYGWKNGWDGKSIEKWQNLFKRQNKIIRLKILLDKNSFKNNSEPVFYPQYAAFVKFFIKKFGLAKFKALHKVSLSTDSFNQTAEKIEKITGIKLSEIEQKYRQYWRIAN